MLAALTPTRSATSATDNPRSRRALRRYRERLGLRANDGFSCLVDAMGRDPSDYDHVWQLVLNCQIVRIASRLIYAATEGQHRKSHLM
jgi:hypothetical protein